MLPVGFLLRTSKKHATLYYETLNELHDTKLWLLAIGAEGLSQHIKSFWERTVYTAALQYSYRRRRQYYTH